MRYKGVIPKARVTSQARKAEVRIKDKIFAGTYEAQKKVAPVFSDFVKNTYTPYAREHKRSVDVEAWRLEVLNRHFGSRRLDEIDRERVERFKKQMHASITQYGRQRTKKDVNHFLEILAKIFTLAVESGKIEQSSRPGRH